MLVTLPAMWEKHSTVKSKKKHKLANGCSNSSLSSSRDAKVAATPGPAAAAQRGLVPCGPCGHTNAGCWTSRLYGMSEKHEAVHSNSSPLPVPVSIAM
jgi:hypothetical protein